MRAFLSRDGWKKTCSSLKQKVFTGCFEESEIFLVQHFKRRDAINPFLARAVISWAGTTGSLFFSAGISTLAWQSNVAQSSTVRRDKIEPHFALIAAAAGTIIWDNY